MDISSYDTNVLLINGITSIAFQLYEPSQDQLQSFITASPDIETTLQESGLIYLFDASQRTIWNFQVTRKDATADIETDPPPKQVDPEPELRVAGLNVNLVEQGSFEPLDLFKSRAPGPTTTNTPTGSAPSPSAPPDANQRGASRGSAPTSAGTNPGDTEFKIASKATLDDRVPSITTKDAYESFITALLSVLSTSFCRRHAAVPLNYRTVLLSALSGPLSLSGRNHEAAVVGTFTAYLTSTGALAVRLSLSLREDLATINETPSAGQVALSSSVVAAPFGVLGNYLGLAAGAGTDGIGQTPDTRLARLRPEGDLRSSHWRDVCVRLLRGRGISEELLEGSVWIALQLTRRKPGEQQSDGKVTPGPSSTTVISWPSSLCFRRRRVIVETPLHSADAAGRGTNDMIDILSDARQWIQTSSERAEVINNRKKAREAAAAKESQPNAPASQPTANSPVDPRRAGNASAMYPTPPDGVQHPPGATPATVVDVNASSPNPPVSGPPPTDADINMGNTDLAAEEAEENSWEANDNSKRGRGDSVLDDDDNLFGDMGEDMFGDSADITDADFSFFDDQPGHEGLSLTGLTGADLSQVSNHAVKPTPPPPPPPPPPINETPASKPQRSSEDDSREMMPPPRSPIFAKPELRHARSMLTDESKAKASSSKVPGTKREPSPFDPDTVFKKVRASLSHPENTPTNGQVYTSRKGSVFDGVDFNPDLPLSNKKYESGGRFDCHNSSSFSTVDASGGKPPTTNYLRWHGKQSRKSPKSLERTNSILKSITGTLESSTLHESPGRTEDSASDADDVSMDSKLEDLADPVDEPTSPFKSSAKRMNVDDDAVSHVTSLRDMESVVEDTDPSLALELPRLAKVGAPETAIAKYFDGPEPLSTQVLLPDLDLITVAQILTEQAVSGNLSLRDTSSTAIIPYVSSETRRYIGMLSRTLAASLQDDLPPALGDTSRCTLKSLLDVADVSLPGTANRPPPRPIQSKEAGAEPPKPTNFYPIPTPHIEVKRIDTKLSVLPSSAAFWDTLGLAPSPGSKDINAVCVFPNGPGLSEFAGTFLDRIRHTYEFLKLGTFGLLDDESSIFGGVVPWETASVPNTPSAERASNGLTLDEGMTSINQCFLSCEASDTNFVVFGVYSPSQPDSIVSVCAAFQRLFEAHKRSLTTMKQAPANELVLQLLPIDFLTAASGLPSSDPRDLIGLALETYDRCTSFGGQMPAPAIVLEQSLPRGIDFRLSSVGSPALMHENTCIHIAYAQSVDERWVTAAWTDNRGSQQMTASYNLGRKGKPIATPWNDVAHAIWETTHDLISRWQVHWRIIITKCGYMDQNESDFWMGLAQTESNASVSLTLISVDTDPSLQLLPPIVRVPVSASNSFYTTPVSTPQASTVSPDQQGALASPAKDSATAATTTAATGDGTAEPADGDAILVDITDQTWGTVLSHRLNTSPSAGQLSNALVSGYLIKRGGAREEDPPAVLEVNILHSDAHSRTPETLMREMLTYFRGLGTLARARGMVNGETDVRPWHIAAAEKGVRALYLLM